jgi:hypothetical protein
MEYTRAPRTDVTLPAPGKDDGFVVIVWEHVIHGLVRTGRPYALSCMMDPSIPILIFPAPSGW